MRRSQQPVARSQEKSILSVPAALCGLLFDVRKGLKQATSSLILATGCWLLATVL
jgi:hypothetical protein